MSLKAIEYTIGNNCGNSVRQLNYDNNSISENTSSEIIALELINLYKN